MHLDRREFLYNTLAASSFAAISPVELAGPSRNLPMAASPEFYELRRYRLTNGPQTKLNEAFFGKALIPGLNRLGITPVGAFSVEIGPETPTYYVILTGASLETLVTADLLLAKDEAFMRAAEPFWNAPASAPAYVRVDSSLMRAFAGWPRITPPAKADGYENRIFQLRTYEQPSHQDHVRKIAMFHDGEFDLFAHAGFGQVFYGDTLVGPRLPNLTYMLSFASMQELEARWKVFVQDPKWKELSSSPKYNYEAIVSNISNLILKPLACSQI